MKHQNKYRRDVENEGGLGGRRRNHRYESVGSVDTDRGYLENS